MKSNAEKIKVAVIGAGLSGLAAAYELAKTKHIEVTVFEAESRVGGRVKSASIDGHSLDLGGFIIYPWYTEYHRLIKELGLKKELEKIGKVKIVYATAEGKMYTGSGNVSLKEKLKIGKELVKAWRKEKPNFRTPDLSVFAEKSIAEFLKQSGLEKGNLAEFLDTVNQGYCYAGLAEYEMSFYAPFVYQTLAKGDLRSGRYFGGNNQGFAQALAGKIVHHGGNIKLQSPVTELGKNFVKHGGKKIKFDAIVLTAPVNDLYKKLIFAPVFPYTRFYAAVMKMRRPIIIKKHKNWSAVFVSPKPKGACITSVIQASHMVPAFDERYIIINYKVTSERAIGSKVLENQLNLELARIFPGSGKGVLVVSHQWKSTMPVATSEFVAEVRAKQGKNTIYFAGDYLGAPSMETAVSSGVHVASLIKQQYLVK